MKITVLKSTVEAALAPILKMVANAKLPADFHPTLTFQSDKQSLSVGCSLPEQKLSVVLSDAVFDEKNTAFDVNLEMFNRMTDAAATGTRLSIEQDAAHVMLNCDDHFIGQLVPMTYKEEKLFLTADKGIQAGIFLPNEGSFACADCPFADRCSGWHCQPIENTEPKEVA